MVFAKHLDRASGGVLCTRKKLTVPRKLLRETASFFVGQKSVQNAWFFRL